MQPVGDGPLMIVSKKHIYIFIFSLWRQSLAINIMGYSLLYKAVAKKNLKFLLMVRKTNSNFYFTTNHRCNKLMMTSFATTLTLQLRK
jgi:hypothetical protein